MDKPNWDDLKWTPQGKQCRGRPKTTWQRTATADLKQLALVWAEAEKITKDHKKWRSNVVMALCPSPDEEDEWE